MNPEKVIFGFFIVLALTLNFGFFRLFAIIALRATVPPYRLLNGIPNPVRSVRA